MSESTDSILAKLRYEPDSGELRFQNVRYILIRPDTVIDFQKAVEAEVGAKRCAEMMMAGGITGGSRSAARYKEAFGLSDTKIIEFMCKMGREIGWGHFSLCELDSAAKRLVIEVAESPFATAYGQSSEGVCHLTRGVLAGLAADIFGTEVQSAETACRACGDVICRFEIVGQPFERKGGEGHIS